MTPFLLAEPTSSTTLSIVFLVATLGAAAACTGAILMILELNSPLNGMVRISPGVLEGPLAWGEIASTSAMP
jgi:hypothetical protein